MRVCNYTSGSIAAKKVVTKLNENQPKKVKKLRMLLLESNFIIENRTEIVY